MTTDSYLYDGAGQRVQQAVTVNGSITTTTTYVAGGLEESVSTGAGTTLTKYFGAGGSLPTLERVGTGGDKRSPERARLRWAEHRRRVAR